MRKDTGARANDDAVKWREACFMLRDVTQAPEPFCLPENLECQVTPSYCLSYDKSRRLARAASAVLEMCLMSVTGNNCAENRGSSDDFSDSERWSDAGKVRNDAEIISFTATPRRVSAGEHVTLRWEARGVDQLTLTWGASEDRHCNWRRRGGLPAAGFLVVRPAESSVYILKSETSEGSIYASVSVRVEK
ncbi:MAG TPA: hypothetical protein VHB50_11280 [Bryobacteraceae bacterium]|nr:hypothetical protein [Bryobacteraceae bacterium]